MKQTGHIRLLILGLSIFVLLFPELTAADFNGEIKPPDGTIQTPAEDSIDYGLCLLGDFIEKTFKLKNTGTKTLRIGQQNPTYLIGSYDTSKIHQYDFQEFNPRPGDETPFNIEPGTEKIFVFRYKADTDTIEQQHKPGLKIAKLTLGMYDAEFQGVPNYKDIKVLDSFKLIARKTIHYIDGYENDYDFDSVYVKPPVKVSWNWQVKNVWKETLKIDSDEFKELSPNPEFEIEKMTFPYTIYSKNVIPWEIVYNPKDMGGDSAIYSLKYHLNQLQYPDSVDYAKIKLHGVGVRQDLALNYAENVSYYNEYTLDIGEVWVGKQKEAWGVLKNKGNLRFGTISQSILNSQGEPDTVFTLTDGIRELPFNLEIDAADTFNIKFNPTQRGTFVSSYVLNSDIARRNIKGIPAGGLNQVIYLKGTGIEPEISVATDTINFGYVVKHDDCPSSATFSFQLSNIGNTALELEDPIVHPPFSVPNPVNMIPAYSQRTMLVVFNADSIPLGNYSDTILIILKNIKPPKDNLKLFVIASSVLPQSTDLRIPVDLKAKPGRLISIPIIVDKEHIKIARIFRDSLTFNPTILRYTGYENIGTATEGAGGGLMINPNSDSSRLGISIEMPPNVYFRPKDSLIILKFNTYLGDKIQTEIAFATPQFGDGRCSKVLTPTTVNGIFTLDSICGLRLKAVPFSTKKFRFEDIYPNPANEKIHFEYEMAFKTDIRINFYNSYGELVEKLIDTELPAGTYQMTYPTNDLTPGIYYFEMLSGLFRQVKKVVLTK